MKIAYVTNYNASNIENWSGLGYYIANALKSQNNELEYLRIYSIPSFTLLYKKLLYKFIKRQNFDYQRHPSVVNTYASQIISLVKPDTDIVFSPGSIPLSLLEINKPKVFYTDATFAGIVGFYPQYANILEEELNLGNYLEQKSLESAKLAIYSSSWAAKSAIENYNLNPDKVKVVPFGANLPSNLSLADIKDIVSKRSSTEYHLLFLGVDWVRKGGEMALRVASKLNQIGIKTTLHIAGIKNLPIKSLPDYVINYGFFRKNNKSEMEELYKLFYKCHFLILPTIADCTPVVFSEANSFGLPCISTDVGGIPTIIEDSKNGFLFSLNDDATVYTQQLEYLFNNKEEYKELCYSSFNEYETRLNWQVCGKKITQLLRDL